MSNLREPYSATALASLEPNPNSECAVDRIGAAGFTNALGLLLWKAKYQADGGAYVNARKGLIGRYRDRYSHESQFIVEAVVDQVLHEYWAEKCHECDGVKEIVDDQLRVTCHGCRGTGVHRFSDYERAGTMKISLDRVKRLGRAIRWLAAIVSGLDSDVNRVMGDQLERC